MKDINCYFNRLPFEWKTPIGYCFAMLFIAVQIYVQIPLLLCILCLFIGFCMFSVCFSNELDQNSKMMETIIRSATDLKGKLSSGTRIEIKRKLCTFVRFHSDSMQLSGSNI